MCSIIGTFAIGIIGFGWLLVSGRSRVPSPPARMTAFMSHLRPAVVSVRPSRNAARAAGTYFAAAKYPSTIPPIAKPHPHDVEERRAPTPRRVGDEEHRQREHQRERARLARPTRTSMRRAPASRERDGRDRDRAPRGRARSTSTTSTPTGRPCVQQRDRGRDEQHAIGGRVEDLAELAALVEVARDVAVDPVGRAEHGEQHGGAAPGGMRLPQHPEEHGDAQQPDHRDEIRNRQNP